jgi:antitoxin CptB
MVSSAVSSALIKKLQWQCRRGMLELDVILSPFLEQYYQDLGENLQNSFEELLSEPDPDIYTWIMGFGACEKKELLPIIKEIRRKMKVA